MKVLLKFWKGMDKNIEVTTIFLQIMCKIKVELKLHFQY